MNTTVIMTGSIAALAKDLAVAQGEMKNPVKDTPNPFFKSLYADLAAVRDCVLPVLARHKLAVVQLPTECEAGAGLVTLLMHESGEYIQTTMLLRAAKQDPQGIGSAMTYARRYALQSIAGVAAEADDDGNHASGHVNGNGTRKPEPTTVVPPDQDLVNEMLDTLSKCETAVEVEAARQVLSLNKGKLTTEGAKVLAKKLKDMQAKFPAKTEAK